MSSESLGSFQSEITPRPKQKSKEKENKETTESAVNFFDENGIEQVLRVGYTISFKSINRNTKAEETRHEKITEIIKENANDCRIMFESGRWKLFKGLLTNTKNNLEIEERLVPKKISATELRTSLGLGTDIKPNLPKTTPQTSPRQTTTPSTKLPRPITGNRKIKDALAFAQTQDARTELQKTFNASKKEEIKKPTYTSRDTIKKAPVTTVEEIPFEETEDWKLEDLDTLPTPVEKIEEVRPEDIIEEKILKKTPPRIPHDAGLFYRPTEIKSLPYKINEIVWYTPLTPGSKSEQFQITKIGKKGDLEITSTEKPTTILSLPETRLSQLSKESKNPVVEFEAAIEATEDEKTEPKVPGKPTSPRDETDEPRVPGAELSTQNEITEIDTQKTEKTEPFGYTAVAEKVKSSRNVKKHHKKISYTKNLEIPSPTTKQKEKIDYEEGKLIPYFIDGKKTMCTIEEINHDEGSISLQCGPTAYPPIPTEQFELGLKKMKADEEGKLTYKEVGDKILYQTETGVQECKIVAIDQDNQTIQLQYGPTISPLLPIEKVEQNLKQMRIDKESRDQENTAVIRLPIHKKIRNQVGRWLVAAGIGIGSLFVVKDTAKDTLNNNMPAETQLAENEQPTPEIPETRQETHVRTALGTLNEQIGNFSRSLESVTLYFDRLSTTNETSADVLETIQREIEKIPELLTRTFSQLTDAYREMINNLSDELASVRRANARSENTITNIERTWRRLIDEQIAPTIQRIHSCTSIDEMMSSAIQMQTILTEATESFFHQVQTIHNQLNQILEQNESRTRIYIVQRGEGIINVVNRYLDENYRRLPEDERNRLGNAIATQLETDNYRYPRGMTITLTREPPALPGHTMELIAEIPIQKIERVERTGDESLDFINQFLANPPRAPIHIQARRVRTIPPEALQNPDRPSVSPYDN